MRQIAEKCGKFQQSIRPFSLLDPRINFKRTCFDRAAYFYEWKPVNVPPRAYCFFRYTKIFRNLFNPCKSVIHNLPTYHDTEGEYVASFCKNGAKHLDEDAIDVLVNEDKDISISIDKEWVD